MTLYIIGNGLDLHIKLATKYADFASYLKENDNDLYEQLLLYFPLCRDWNNFEECLLEFKVMTVLKDLDDFLPAPDNESSGKEDIYFDQAINIIKELSIRIKNSLNDWIVSLNYSEVCNLTDISFKDNSKILTFNYTSTIETFYKPKAKILHIHNLAKSRQMYLPKPDECNSKSPEFEDSEIILGHSPSSHRQIYHNDPRFDSYQNELRSINFEKLLEFIDDSEKKSAQIINENESFFNELYNCDEVIVYGHSLGDCDIPYFIKIVSSVSKNASFTFYYFTNEDLKKINTFTSTYVKNHKCNYISWKRK